MRKIGLAIMAAAMGAATLSAAQATERHRHMSNYEMMYGKHNHYYHHFYRHPHHNATATGGPSGGIPHRN